MKRLNQQIGFAVGLLLISMVGGVAMAQSEDCESAYNQDTKDCFNTIQSANSFNNNMVRGVASIAPSQGGYAPSANTQLAGSGSANNLQLANGYCQKKLDDCKTRCDGTPQYQQACQNVIGSYMAGSGTATAGNTTEAAAAGNINTASNTSAGSAYQDQNIDQTSNLSPDAQVDQVRCSTGMAIAVCMRALSLVQGIPSTTPSTGSIPVVQIAPPVLGTVAGSR